MYIFDVVCVCGRFERRPLDSMCMCVRLIRDVFAKVSGYNIIIGCSPQQVCNKTIHIDILYFIACVRVCVAVAKKKNNNHEHIPLMLWCALSMAGGKSTSSPHYTMPFHDSLLDSIFRNVIR